MKLVEAGAALRSLIHSYTPTFLHSYTPTLLHSYNHTLIPTPSLYPHPSKYSSDDVHDDDHEEDHDPDGSISPLRAFQNKQPSFIDTYQITSNHHSNKDTGAQARTRLQRPHSTTSNQASVSTASKVRLSPPLHCIHYTHYTHSPPYAHSPSYTHYTVHGRQGLKRQ